MIHFLSQDEVEHLSLSPALKQSLVQSIDPQVNPGHVLTPPRHWLEAVATGEYTWNFFRLRYKNLLRRREKLEPAKFQTLLNRSVGEQALYLTCGCGGPNCHAELAAEFLETQRRIQASEKIRMDKKQIRLTRPDNTGRPTRQLMLSALIEHPVAHTAAG
ncbi:MAG: hypothetical protein OEW39_01365 [Deltaproteobacteria bacterium]|nr:hypothetical protein [Deltaproteobacteria bacterium]